MPSNASMSGNRPPRMPKFNMSWIYLVIIITLGVIFFTDGDQSIGQSAVRRASYSNFKAYVDRGYAKSVVVNKQESKLRVSSRESWYMKTLLAMASSTSLSALPHGCCLSLSGSSS